MNWIQTAIHLRRAMTPIVPTTAAVTRHVPQPKDESVRNVGLYQIRAAKVGTDLDRHLIWCVRVPAVGSFCADHAIAARDAAIHSRVLRHFTVSLDRKTVIFGHASWQPDEFSINFTAEADPGMPDRRACMPRVCSMGFVTANSPNTSTIRHPPVSNHCDRGTNDCPWATSPDGCEVWRNWAVRSRHERHYVLGVHPGDDCTGSIRVDRLHFVPRILGSGICSRSRHGNVEPFAGGARHQYISSQRRPGGTDARSLLLECLGIQTCAASNRRCGIARLDCR